MDETTTLLTQKKANLLSSERSREQKRSPLIYFVHLGQKKKANLLSSEHFREKKRSPLIRFGHLRQKKEANLICLGRSDAPKQANLISIERGLRGKGRSSQDRGAGRDALSPSRRNRSREDLLKERGGGGFVRGERR
jgi:hypothetical protein